MRFIKILFFSTCLLLSMQTAIHASASAGLEWRYHDGEQSMDTLKLNWETSQRIDIEGSYNIDDEDLTVDIIYNKKTDSKIQPRLGVGVRDLLQKSSSDLSLADKVEVIAGFSVNLGSAANSRLYLTMDVKAVPSTLFDHSDEERLKPSLSVSLNYRIPYALPKPRKPENAPGSIKGDDFQLLACLVTAEAGNESFDGQIAIAAVVLNRINSNQFPNTVREVVYQRGQFSSLPKLSSVTPSESSRKAVIEALKGSDPSRGALYFYNPRTCSPEGQAFFNSGKLKVTTQIGNHVFLIDR